MTSVPGEEPTRAEYPERWEERWSTGKTGWDQGIPHKSLVELLDTHGEELGIPKQGKALIPGCGRGYDLPVFAERGLHTIGLDISETGAAAAKKYISERPITNKDGSMEIQVVDVFTFDGGGGFDVIYDYTFLCALPPDFRSPWGQQITSLSKDASSTRLITLIWPIDGNPGGPPYALDENTYHELLDDHWELIFLKDVPAEQVRHTGPPGKEKIGVWKRKL